MKLTSVTLYELFWGTISGFAELKQNRVSYMFPHPLDNSWPTHSDTHTKSENAHSQKKQVIIFVFQPMWLIVFFTPV